jgi:methionyl-tRNA formyltransferase
VNPVRILLCLNRDLASNVALNHLLPSLEGHTVLIGLSERVGSVAADEPAPRQMLRMAEQSFPNEVLFPLIESLQQADDGNRWLTFAEVERCRGIPVEPLSAINSPESFARLTSFLPDLVVTIRYGSILKSAVISLPRFGVLNLHSGILPDYRGVLATFRALLNRDARIGCTLHYISDGTIDTGDVVATASLPVDPRKSLLGHVLDLYGPGVALVARAIENLAAGREVRSRPQGPGGTYFSYPSHAEWQAFRATGHSVLEPAELGALARRYLCDRRLGFLSGWIGPSV